MLAAGELDLWSMDLAQTFTVCLLAILLWQSIDWADLGGGTIGIPMGHWSRLESKEKVVPVDLSGVPAFAPQNPPTPLWRQDAQMFIFAIRKTVMGVRIKARTIKLFALFVGQIVLLFSQRSGQRQSNVATSFTTGMPFATSHFSLSLHSFLLFLYNSIDQKLINTI